MSVTPGDFLQLAVELYRSPLAIRRRAAISRAYYAAYHAGAQLLEALGFAVSIRGWPSFTASGSWPIIASISP